MGPLVRSSSTTFWLEQPRPWADGVSFSPCRHGWQWADAGGPVVLSLLWLDRQCLGCFRSLEPETQRERESRSELLSTGCLILWALCDFLHSSFLYAASMKQGHIPKCWALKNVKQRKQARSLPGVNKLAKLFPLPPVLPRPPSTLHF